MSELSAGNYGELLVEIQERIRSAQYEALKAVNKELIALYWDIGQMIVTRQQGETWGKSKDVVVDKRSLQVPPATDSFTEEMVSDLPTLAKRYVLHTIVPGTPLAASVHLKMSGTFRGKPNGAWMPMQAEQLITVPKGFVWKATIGSGFFKLMAADYYTNESSRMQFSL